MGGTVYEKPTGPCGACGQRHKYFRGFEGEKRCDAADELFSSGEDERIPELSRILCFTNFENIFAALKNGFADAIAGHETALKERMKSNTGKYRILEETLLSVELGVAFKIGGGEELAALISKALVVMRNDGFTASVLKRYGVNPDDVMTGEV